MQPTPDRIALRRIHSAAQRSSRKLAAHISSATCDVVPLNLVPPLLTVPNSLAPKLSRMGVDATSAENISVAVTRALRKLKTIFESDFARRSEQLQAQAHHFCDSKFLVAFPATYATIYKNTVHAWTTYIADRYIPRFLKAQARYGRRRVSPISSKPPFNQSAVPILERFFASNAFPSRLEKYELASESAMEYRQIHVWFQNRRSRSRKEGKDLIRPSKKDALLEELEKTVADAFLPHTSDEDVNDAPLGISVHSHLLPLDTGAPDHAFPAPYPPICSYDPFPITSNGGTFLSPWPRTVASQQPRRAAIDLDDLVRSFSRITISDDDLGRALSNESCTPSYNAVSRNTVGFVTPCSRAPHPAMIRRQRRPSRLTYALGCTAPVVSPCGALKSGRPQTPTSRGDRQPAAPNTTTSACGAIAARPKKRTLSRHVPSHPPTLPVKSVQISPAESSDSPRIFSAVSSSAASSASDSDLDSPLPTPETRLLDSLPFLQCTSSIADSDALTWLTDSIAPPVTGWRGANSDVGKTWFTCLPKMSSIPV
ncbi:hypothetical protein C8Q79DRAFT_73165 [Trametes meyenii]|nr:hypothetical protein C8Q79DRAFT_73165 [Trametes meyenii]